jgi:hypothetical protein
MFHTLRSAKRLFGSLFTLREPGTIRRRPGSVRPVRLGLRLEELEDRVAPAIITPAPLTVTGITANDKRYDGSTSATLNTAGAALVGVFAGDVVTLDASAATGTFANAAVGNNIPVTVSGLTLGGPQAVDYMLVPLSVTANILPPLPKVSVNSSSALEGTSGLTPFVFQIHLTAAAPRAATYDVYTTDGTAKAGVNFIGITAGDSAHGGTVTVAPGSAFATVTVFVIAGSVPVTPATVRATFMVRLSDPLAPDASLASGTGTIIAQAAVSGPSGNAPVLISNVSSSEGTNGLTPFVFQIRLASAARNTVTYDVYTTDGTAKAGVNFIGITAGDSAHGGTVTFAQGSAFATVTVFVIAGSLPVTPATVRATFTVNLSDPSQPGVPLASGTGIITAQVAVRGGGARAPVPATHSSASMSRAVAILGGKKMHDK